MGWLLDGARGLSALYMACLLYALYIPILSLLAVSYCKYTLTHTHIYIYCTHKIYIYINILYMYIIYPPYWNNPNISYEPVKVPAILQVGFNAPTVPPGLENNSSTCSAAGSHSGASARELVVLETAYWMLQKWLWEDVFLTSHFDHERL